MKKPCKNDVGKRQVIFHLRKEWAVSDHNQRAVGSALGQLLVHADQNIQILLLRDASHVENLRSAIDSEPLPPQWIPIARVERLRIGPVRKETELAGIE